MRAGWIKTDKAPVKNVDLWKKLVDLLKIHTVTWVWVKGHSDNELNSRCDEMAVSAYKKDNLEPDLQYEQDQNYRG